MGSVKWRLFYIDLQYIENRSRASVDYVTTMFSEPLNVATPVLDALQGVYTRRKSLLLAAVKTAVTLETAAKLLWKYR